MPPLSIWTHFESLKDPRALLRKIAANLLKLETSLKRGVEAKRKRAAWDSGYLIRVLQAVAQSPA